MRYFGLVKVYSGDLTDIPYFGRIYLFGTPTSGRYYINLKVRRVLC